MEFNFDAFRANLGALIDSRGLTFARISEETGITAPTISRYMSGKRTPDVSCVVKLAKFFSVSVDWLLGLSDSKFEEIPADIRNFAIAFSIANSDDKYVIDAVLKKYM